MMLHDQSAYLISGAVALGALVILAVAGLRGWTQWIALKQQELAHFSAAPNQRIPESGVPMAANRIELADLKERVRKLEAIAAGVDL